MNSVQYFRCFIGDTLVEGMFGLVFFSNGEYVEVVAEPREDNGYFAYAVRRPIDHRLWLHPWCMQGTSVGKKSSFKQSCYFFIYLELCYIITCIFLDVDIISFLLFACAWGIISFFFCFVLYLFDQGIVFRGSKTANKIFATLGYDKPKQVDMEMEFFHFHCTFAETDPNFYVDITTPQYQQDKEGKAKWVTFYREAPPIPNYITVIETQYQPKKE